MTFALLATPGASVVKWYGRAPSSVKPTAESRLGSFGNRGNGRYRGELRQALSAIGRYLAEYQLPHARALLRLDGQYGSGAVLADLAGFSFVLRGKDYSVLDHPLVQARLRLPPDQLQQRPESQVVRSLYDCPQVPVGADRRTLPRGGSHPSRRQPEKPGGPHAGRCRLRTLLHHIARACVHRLGCRRAVSASWRL
jgi:hypothetical protein